MKKSTRVTPTRPFQSSGKARAAAVERALLATFRRLDPGRQASIFSLALDLDHDGIRPEGPEDVAERIGETLERYKNAQAFLDVMAILAWAPPVRTDQPDEWPTPEEVKKASQVKQDAGNGR